MKRIWVDPWSSSWTLANFWSMLSCRPDTHTYNLPGTAAGWKDSYHAGHSAINRIYLGTMVTIVDSGTFVAEFSSRQALAAQSQTSRACTSLESSLCMPRRAPSSEAHLPGHHGHHRLLRHLHGLFSRVIGMHDTMHSPCMASVIHTCHAGHPAVKRICLDTMVTIVDSGTFVVDFSSREALAPQSETRQSLY